VCRCCFALFHFAAPTPTTTTTTTTATRVRELKSDLIGQLVTITGTVTRTSEVRPELLYGTFKCAECGMLERYLEQQFKYVEPGACPNTECRNQNKWELVPEESVFVDWQRLRLQENSDEIPPGMPCAYGAACLCRVVATPSFVFGPPSCAD